MLDTAILKTNALSLDILPFTLTRHLPVIVVFVGINGFCEVN